MNGATQHTTSWCAQAATATPLDGITSFSIMTSLTALLRHRDIPYMMMMLMMMMMFLMMCHRKAAVLHVCTPNDSVLHRTAAHHTSGDNHSRASVGLGVGVPVGYCQREAAKSASSPP
jgi:hypothetical protein